MSDVLLVGSGYGRRVGLRVAAESVDAARRQLPFWWVDDNGEPEQVWTVPAEEHAEAKIRAMELWIAEHAAGVVFVHAGVVAVNGRALLLPGRSMAGKTTLVAALLRAGADYLSDEYAVLTPDGLVHPYPRPLSMRTPSGRAAVPATDVGAMTRRSPAFVGAVAFLTFEPDAVWAPRVLTSGGAVLRLLDNTVSAQTDPERALSAAAFAVEHAQLIAGERNEAASAAHELIGLNWVAENL